MGHWRASDLRAATLLANEATTAVISLTEGVHQAVWRTLGMPGGSGKTQTRGLTGFVFERITGISQWVGRGVISAVNRLEPLLAQLDAQKTETYERAAVIAALNGVMGDRLQVSANPLATPMTLRFQELDTHVSKGLELNLPLSQQIPNASHKLLVVLHGLCMNDLQWTTQQEGKSVSHATAIAHALGYTPVYLRYNSGLHVSQNGQDLARQLAALLAAWPVPVTCLSLLTHSMGGLVARSAVASANQAGLVWPKQLKHLVFLGTPHHGAPLERAGNWIDVLLGSTPYSRPFAKLGQLRSAGVTDLRYGHVLDADWQGHDRFRRKPDTRTPLPLPDGVACFAVAATLAAKRSAVADRLVGDGLVPLHSALGHHEQADRQLHFASAQQLLVYRTSHMQLLSSPLVTQQLLKWLA
ncbi:MAG: alpha/beta hydrolase [Rhodoferax sp.]|nr:alpha/beta hydrolase [Rhodoferax sp.]